MKRILIVATLFLASTTLFAQSFRTATFQRGNLNKFENLLDREYDSIGDTGIIKGSPFHRATFLKGDIYENDEKTSEGVYLRYNAFTDIIEKKGNKLESDASAVVVPKTGGITAKIGNDYFVTMVEPNSNTVQYFQVLFIGEKTNLFKKHRKLFKESKEAQTGMTRDVPAAYRDSPIYFMIDENLNFIELPRSKSKFVKALGKHQGAVKEYIKSNNLKVTKDTDLVKIITYFSTL